MEVFIPQEHINPDEIGLDEHMDQEQEDLHHHEDNNMQVGFVELIESAADLVFTSIFQSNGSSVPHTNADAIRLWHVSWPLGLPRIQFQFHNTRLISSLPCF